MADRPLIRLTLRPLPRPGPGGCADVPVESRLRAALKTLLRRYSLKCVKVEDVPDESPEGEAG
jgi:hypothetical protein